MFLFAVVPWCVSSTQAQQTTNLYTTTWIGNTIASNLDHVQQNFYDISVLPNGTIFTDVVWDEGDYECTQFNSNGNIVEPANWTHGWGPTGGMAVACNSNYLFLAQNVDYVDSGYWDTNTWPSNGYVWYGVSRRQISDIQQGAPFVGGLGSPSNSGVFLPQSYLLINYVTNTTVAAVTGLAANNGRLYVADPYQSAIHVYNLLSTNIVFSANWSLPGVFRIALDANSNLWAIQRGNPTVVVEFNANGILQTNQITFLPGANPISLAFDSTNYLLVADEGPDQDIKYYSLTNLSGTPTAVARTLGTNLMSQTGTNMGTVAPGYFYGLTSVGVDSNHSVYVSWNYDGPPDGVTNLESLTRTAGVLQKFNSAGSNVWTRYGLNFVDCAAVDPASDTDFYSFFNHYRMNWSNTAPGSQWSLAGVTYNKYLYPTYPIASEGQPFSPVMRRLNNGQLYMYECEALSKVLCVMRFQNSVQGECAIPCTFFCKTPDYVSITNLYENSESIWYDKNGDGVVEANEFSEFSGAGHLEDNTWGWWVDVNGNVWETVNGGSSVPRSGLREYYLGGFDSNGTPLYSYTNMTVYSTPTPFLNQTDNGLERVLYDAANDIMYLGGYTASYQSGTWGCFRVLARYDNWSAENRNARWVLPLPYNTANSVTPISFDVAGSFIFVASGAALSQIAVYRTADGAFVGYMTPNNGLFTLADTGWIDYRPFSIHAFQRANGQYIVTLEDDGKCKTVVYQWTPNWPSRPLLGVTSVTNAQVTLRITGGSSGSDYKLQSSTDLKNWATLAITNWTSYPASAADSLAINQAKYYRIVSVP